MLRIFEVAGEDIDRLPPPGAHDRGLVMPGAEQILSGTNVQRVTLKASISLRSLQAITGLLLLRPTGLESDRR